MVDLQTGFWSVKACSAVHSQMQDAGVSHNRPNARKLFLVVGSLLDQFIDDVVGFVDVKKSAIAKTPNGGVIFFSGDVIVSLVQKFLRTTESARAVHSRIDRRMIAQVLAVVNRGTLDFVDSFVDLVYGVLLLLVHVMRGS